MHKGRSPKKNWKNVTVKTRDRLKKIGEMIQHDHAAANYDDLDFDMRYNAGRVSAGDMIIDG